MGSREPTLVNRAVAQTPRYDANRRPVMNDITLRNRRFGPEAAMQMVEERAPKGFARIEDVIARADLEEIAKSFSAAAGLDAETVNERPPFVSPAPLRRRLDRVE
jgi:5-methylphenazine-1-carboxylate 1-monooxygenase